LAQGRGVGCRAHPLAVLLLRQLALAQCGVKLLADVVAVAVHRPGRIPVGVRDAIGRVHRQIVQLRNRSYTKLALVAPCGPSAEGAATTGAIESNPYQTPGAHPVPSARARSGMLRRAADNLPQ